MKKRLLIFVALFALMAGIIFQRSLVSLVNVIPAGPPELESAFPDLDGKLHKLSQWKGKVLIVNFWATWCSPCLQEMPEFVKLQQEFESKGLQFIGILTDDEADAARDFLKTKPLNYPVLDGSIGGRQLAQKLGDTAGVLPVSVVFDPNGKRAYTEIGIFTRDEVMEKIKPWIQ